jgi:hypothetical protein
MPGVTPIWAIRYPLIGEPVDPAAFKNFADDVDAAMDAIEAAANGAATGRNFVHLTRGEGPDTIATNVEADVVWTTQLPGDDPGGWWTSGANIILPDKGLYQVSVWSDQHPTTTTTSQRWRVKVNGVFRTGHLGRPATASVGVSGMTQGVVYNSTAGHALAATYKWTGTVSPVAFPETNITVAQLVKLP